jgi:hypothetical protein
MRPPPPTTTPPPLAPETSNGDSHYTEKAPQNRKAKGCLSTQHKSGPSKVEDYKNKKLPEDI